MSGPFAPHLKRHSVLIGPLLAALAVTSGCGQSGPLALPSSAQLPSPQTNPPQTDEGDAQSQEEERTPE
ncbi:MAG TPA: lipoprotein [Gammaproteobacteria bacterium]|nr:lipoprotein [Gammaproteobacteria bacterium]